MNKKIVLATDHAGFELKEQVKEFLQGEGYEVDDVGAHEFDEKDDYPQFMYEAGKKVAAENCRGIIFGGSGQGEAIMANKVKGVRAALYYGKELDIVELSRTHNNANILSMGARFVSKEQAIEAITLWLKTAFDSEERHARRVKQISDLECKV